MTNGNKTKNILICAGSGIGNVILQLPLLKKFESQGFHCDLLLRNVPHNTKEVLSLLLKSSKIEIFNINEIKRNKHYDIIYETRSFNGGKDINYCCNSNLLISSKDIFGVEEYDIFSETEYEFAALNKLINLQYSKNDLALTQNLSFSCSSRKIAIFTSGKKTNPAIKRNLPSIDWDVIIDTLKIKNYEPVSIGFPNEYINGCINKTSTNPIEFIDNIRQCQYFIGTDMGLIWLARSIGLNGSVFLGPTAICKTKNSLLENNILVFENKNVSCPIFPCWKQRNIIQSKYKCNNSCIKSLVSTTNINKILESIK
ncbi:hypothetical protein [Sutterella sp.]|uniref:hypothetical protein n=1 Tax=Sutterella sp. TaxID=1981025 RepID=UPI0026DF74F4|nr:hypothetical protein [Sutterella sp.]MDO5531775.1 hypothetical protein [Sutterella sp.]